MLINFDELAGRLNDDDDAYFCTPIDTQDEELTYPEAVKILLKFAAPLVLRNGLFAGYEFSRVLLVKQYNKKLVPAFTDFRTTEAMLQSLLYGMLYSIPPMIRKVNKKNAAPEEKLEVGIIFRQGIIFSAIAGLITAIIAEFFVAKFFKLINQPGVVIQNSEDYFRWSSLGYFFDVIYRSEVRCMFALDNKKTALISDFLDVTLDIGMSYVLINGKWGFPEMGLAGAAVGYTVSKLITLLFHTGFIYSYTIFFNAILKQYEFFSRNVIFDCKILKEIARDGIPLGVDYSLTVAATTIIGYFCGLNGTRGLLALQVASLYGGPMRLLVGTLFPTINSLCGKYVTEKGRNVITVANAAMLLAFTAAILGLIIVLSTPGFIADILIDKYTEADSYNMAIKLLREEGFLQVFGALRATSVAVLSSRNDNFFPMMVTFFCYVVINISIAAIAKFALDKDESWIYGSQVIGCSLSITLLLMRLASHYKAEPIQGEATIPPSIANNSSCFANAWHSIKARFTPDTGPTEKTRLRSNSVISTASMQTLA
ncbi:MAG: hypothetical protein A3E82_09055 [Gammaproteobacteria bacterium RIFCSPHIGHO2_12_FULL_38_11]|nr:MAG: hypothetical protein A3E82_09055 [Gammaproteobacteria bacterium RIFCSPHIGHO2_12_FULL_38_11]